MMVALLDETVDMERDRHGEGSHQWNALGVRYSVIMITTRFT